MNFEAGPPSGVLWRYDIPYAAFDTKPRLCNSTDATSLGETSAKLTRWPNSAINADCCDSKGASKINLFGGYLDVMAPTNPHFTAPFSSYIPTPIPSFASNIIFSVIVFSVPFLLL